MIPGQLSANDTTNGMTQKHICHNDSQFHPVGTKTSELAEQCVLCRLPYSLCLMPLLLYQCLLGCHLPNKLFVPEPLSQGL